MGFLSTIPVADEVEKKVTDLAVAAIFRGFKYMFCYKSLAKDFSSKIDDINNEEDRMNIEVDKEKNNGKKIHADVLKWLADVKEIQKKSDLSPSFKCIKCLPIPNPISRLRLGRNAVQKSKIVTELIDTSTKLFEKEIAFLPPPSEDVPTTNTVFQDFPSRQEAYGKLWNQLENEDCLILGIYGMPGAGKTLMMEQLRKEAQGQKKKIFDKVILAVVGSVTFDVIKLQDQLASDLNCKLESRDDKKNRAHQLKNSMMNSDKILVIFDDVWGEISVCDIIGTSFDDGNSWKGCKILFTSREKSHCSNNNCKDPVEITELKDQEALDMFKNTIGTDQAESPPDESLVQQVCRKCAGLPLAIHAVGKALKCKNSPSWKDALAKLETCKIESIEGIKINSIYACFKWSLDNLSKDAKQCLLLCSLLDADEYINIDSLSDIAEGSQLVYGGRDKVHAMVDILKSASLLLVREDEEKNFRLHDIIRAVARSTAVKEHSFFIERCGRELPGNSADYGAGKVLLLELEKDDFYFPPDLECSSLRTLWLVAPKRTEHERPCKINIPKFQGDMFSNLRFLMLQRLYWRQHLYVESFNKLRTLIVADCNLVDVDVTCFPESLQTLCIWSCDLPASLDLAKLINLRKLEIIYGRNELRMVPNTISSLSYLEELHLQIPSWDDCMRTLVPKFTEISKLTCLRSLIIYWSDFEHSQDTSILHKLKNFDIRVGVLLREYEAVPDVSAKKRIELTGKLQFEGFQNLVERAEIVKLRDTDVDINRILDSNQEAFKDLRKLYIEVSSSMKYLGSFLPYEIQSQQSWLSFSNLTTLGIRGCSAMKYLCNNFVAEQLMKLQDLYISDCDRMEAIVMNEGGSDGKIITFSKVKSLHLLSLSKLKTFYWEKKGMHSSSASMMDNSVISSVQPQPLFDGMVAFPSLEEIKISGLNDTVSDIWGKNYYDDNLSSSFRKLESLEVIKCSGLKNVFPHSPMASHIVMHLKKMNVNSCKMMREIIGTGEREEITDDGKFGLIVFPELTQLDLVDLPKLSRWYTQSGEATTYKVQFPVLLKLKLEALNIDLEEIEFGGDDSLCQLLVIILSCDKKIQLPSAWKLPLYNLESLNLRHCLSDVLKSQCFFHKLKFLIVDEPECSTLFSFSVLESLKQLQGLVISNCSMLEEIVEDEDAKGDEVSGMDKKTITFFNLQSVLLDGLPNLKSFFHGTNYELHMPSLVRVGVDNCGISTLFTCSFLQELKQLEDLVVCNCKLLEGIVADTRDSEASDTNEKIITLPKLSLVKLHELPNLKSFIHGADYELHMPALVNISVVNCGLSTLFTCSALQKLKQLRELSVDSCRVLEGIVADTKGIEASGTKDKIIMLPKLSSVKLEKLPNLKSFIRGANYELHVPAVVHVGVINCGLSTLFTCSVLRKLKLLEGLFVDSCELLEGIVADTRGIEDSDTSDKIITLPKLSLVKLHKLPNLKSFIHGTNYELHMPALVDMRVVNCGLSTLFTCSVLQKLKQLKVLFVDSCELLEGIVADTRGIKASDTHDKIITLPKLSSVHLDKLPNLRSFIHGVNYELHMPALEGMIVANCVLTTLFPCSVFQTLQQLKWLVVYECRLLESIGGDARGIKTSDTKIFTLPQLTKVLLRDLPNFKCLSLAVGYDLDMPMLLEFRLFSCPRIKNLSSLKTGPTPVNVFSEWHDREEVPDLNDYIKQYRKICDSSKQQPLNVSLFSFAWSCPWAC